VCLKGWRYNRRQEDPSCRYATIFDRRSRSTWAYPFVVGRALPTLPIWLDDELAVALDLEASYEETCRALRIR
jgi:hypothetical protein